VTSAVTTRKSFWRTEVVAILGLAAFVLIAQAVAPLAADGVSESLQLPLGIVLAAAPAALWLAVFYAQDRAEPEPRSFLVAVAALAALLAAAVGQPLIQDVLRVDAWMHRDSLTEFLAGALVVGVVQEVVKFAAVRFSVYYSAEFDQRIDGVLYGTAAGVGYATMLNLGTVFAAGGFADLGAGVTRIVVTALVHSALGGVIGYFLARARFDARPIWWMPAGLLLAALINSAIAWLRSEIGRTGLVLDASGIASAGYNPWPPLALSAAVAAALTALVFALMKRAGERPVAAQLNGRDTLVAAVAFGAAAVALAGGLLLRDSVESRVKVHAEASGLQFAYPDGWRLDMRRAADGVFVARDPDGDVAFELRAVAIDPHVDDATSISQVAGSLALNRARELEAYRSFELSSDGPTGAGSFAFVTGAGNALQENIPVVLLGEDRFVRKGGRVYVFTMHSTEAGRAVAAAKFDRFVQSTVLP